MNYDVNVFAYGKGRALLGESIVQVSADSADEAVVLAREAFKDAGERIVVRGVNPAPVQSEVTEQPKKRGRPRG